jgi:predicted transcriptional regulator
MTILEAADAMERAHGTRLLVREGSRFVGLLTEDDIVQKVLAAGRRPDLVRVDDIMSAGWEAADGTIILEEAETVPEYEDATIESLGQGLCEECGSLTADLDERNGLIVCSDCTRSLFRLT